MEARVTKVARVSARFSKSLARRRFRPNQEKVRSTSPAARQDDEAFHVVAALDDLPAQDRHFSHGSLNLPGVVAAIGPDQFGPGKRRRILSSTSPAPSRSWIAAEWTTTRIGSPSVSTRAWILRPFTFLPAS
jgi:hypothetical protein